MATLSRGGAESVCKEQSQTEPVCGAEQGRWGWGSRELRIRSCLKLVGLEGASATEGQVWLTGCGPGSLFLSGIPPSPLSSPRFMTTLTDFTGL